MTCLRCRGWMVYDRFTDLRDDTGQVHSDGWRCLNCGAIVDPVVLHHHRAKPSAKPTKARRRWTRNVAAKGIAMASGKLTAVELTSGCAVVHALLVDLWR